MGLRHWMHSSGWPQVCEALIWYMGWSQVQQYAHGLAA
jgi:hypothetical protein